MTKVISLCSLKLSICHSTSAPTAGLLLNTEIPPVKKAIFYSLFLLTIASCSTGVKDSEHADLVASKSSHSETGLQSLTLSIHYVDDNNQLYNDDALPDLIYLQFPLIPGAVIGDVLTEAKYSTFASIGQDLTLDLKSIRDSFQPYATPLLATDYNTGLNMNPADTRLLRVGTFAYSPGSGEMLGATGLGIVASQEIQQLILVYFDRPASLTGSVRENDILFEYDIHLNYSGFFLVKVEYINDDHYRLTRYEPDQGQIIEESLTIQISSDLKIRI